MENPDKIKVDAFNEERVPRKVSVFLKLLGESTLTQIKNAGWAKRLSRPISCLRFLRNATIKRLFAQVTRGKDATPGARSPATRSEVEGTSIKVRFTLVMFAAFAQFSFAEFFGPNDNIGGNRVNFFLIEKKFLNFDGIKIYLILMCWGN